MSARSIFRQASIDRLSSPEQLDRLMVVTSPQGWVALLGVWLALAVAVLWSIFGSIPTTVSGTGIIQSSAGVREVEILGSGVVEFLAVEEGDLIDVGDMVATIGQPQAFQQITQARARVRLLEEERELRLSFTATNSQLEGETIDREQEGVETQLEVVQDRIGWLEGRVSAEREARDLGLITEEVVRTTTAQLESARGEVHRLNIELQNTGLRRLLLDNRAVETTQQMEERIREAKLQVESLELDFEQGSTVRSPYRGYVREIRTDVGQLAMAGLGIISLELVGAPLHAVVFVSRDGKRIQPGMETQVAPETVRREEYGFMVGSVTTVSAQPSTPQGIRRVLNNDILVEQLTSQGAPFMVTLELITDPGTVSGFQWSSGNGPSITVESGTGVSVQVVVARRRPISLVLPALRKLLGTAA